MTYFDSDGMCFHQDALRQQERLLCYCFDIRYSDLDDATSAKTCRDFVIDKTRDKQCVCEQRNPSGRCCLRDFPKQEE